MSDNLDISVGGLKLEVQPPTEEGGRPKLFLNGKELPEGKRIGVHEDGTFDVLEDASEEGAKLTWNKFRTDDGALDVRKAYETTIERECTSAEDAFLGMLDAVTGPLVDEEVATVVMGILTVIDANVQANEAFDKKIAIIKQALELMAVAGKVSAESALETGKMLVALSKRLDALEARLETKADHPYGGEG